MAASLSLQQKLLRIMLWSLGAAALLGGLAVLISDRDVTWRVAVTCILAAIVSGLCIPISRLMDREPTRRVGLIGVSLSLATFLLSLLGVWGQFIHSAWEVEFAVTAVFFAPIAAAAFAFSWLASNPKHRLAGHCGVLTAIVELALCLLAVWADEAGLSNEDEWATTAGVLALLFPLLPLCLINASAGDRRHWRWIGVAAALASIATAIIGIWFVHSDDPAIFTTFVCAACVVAHANLLVLVPLPSSVAWARWGTLLAGAVAALAIVAESWLGEVSGARDVLFRITAAAGIAAGCGSIAMIVLYRLNRRPEVEIAAPAEIRSVTLFCPGCRVKQDLPLNGATCRSCGLRINIKVHAPACPACGYSLLGIRAERCPECGAPTADTATAESPPL